MIESQVPHSRVFSPFCDEDAVAVGVDVDMRVVLAFTNFVFVDVVNVSVDTLCKIIVDVLVTTATFKLVDVSGLFSTTLKAEACLTVLSSFYLVCVTVRMKKI